MIEDDSTRPAPPLPRAKKSLGQNFLIDRSARRRIVEALALRPGEPVLEIGPGRGALTEPLVEAAGRIAAVELDRTLAQALRRRFPPERLVVLERDVLSLEPDEVAEALGLDPGAPLILVGNLPYNISKPVAQKLIRDRARVGRAVLMFQREVARRLTARPGGRRYGPLGILAGFAYAIRPLFDLPPRAFHPRPKVHSTVTRWQPLDASPLDPITERRLRRCLAVCFARRRRTLRNNLRGALGDDGAVDALLDATGIDGELRAEALPPDAFLRLAAASPVFASA